MTEPSHFVASRVERDLHAFEAQLSETLVLGARLAGSIASARPGLSPHPAFAQAALLRFSRVNQLLIEANGETARGHLSLRRDADTMQIPYEPTDPGGIREDTGQAVAA